MAGILEDLANAYSVPLSYLKSGLTPRTSQGTGADMTNALSMPSGDSMYMPPTIQAEQSQGIPAPAPVGLLGPQGFGGSGGQDATAAATPVAAPAAAPAAAPIAPPSPADAGGGGVANLPANLPTATGPADVTVGDGTTNTSGAGGTPDQTAQAGGGILSNIINQGMAAAQDPDPGASQSFLGKLSDGFKEIGDKLTNLSPAASQGLISAGMTMLAANSGGRNLSQIVGEGGIAGVNQYQTIVQNQIAAKLKQQELAQNLWEKQQQIQTERNKPTGFQPGEVISTPAMQMQGVAPQQVGGQKVASWQEKTDVDGIVHKIPVDYAGNPLGPGYISNESIPQPQQDVINKAVTAQGDANQALTRTQGYLQRLSQTQVPAGWRGNLATRISEITGNVDEGQQLQQEVQQNIRNTLTSGFKATVGGRLTQGEVNMLRQGIPQNADSESLSRFMTAYGHLQEDTANRAGVTADYARGNRGMLGNLSHDTTIGGVLYPAGTGLNEIVAGTAKPVQQTAAPTAPATAPATVPTTAPTTAPATTPVQPAPRVAAQAVVNQAIRAARNGDKVAQAALTRQRISWS